MKTCGNNGHNYNSIIVFARESRVMFNDICSRRRQHQCSVIISTVQIKNKIQHTSIFQIWDCVVRLIIIVVFNACRWIGSWRSLNFGVG